MNSDSILARLPVPLQGCDGAVVWDHLVVQLVLNAERLQGRWLVQRTGILLQVGLGQGRLSCEPIHGVKGQDALQEVDGYTGAFGSRNKRKGTPSLICHFKEVVCSTEQPCCQSVFDLANSLILLSELEQQDYGWKSTALTWVGSFFVSFLKNKHQNKITSRMKSEAVNQIKSHQGSREGLKRRSILCLRLDALS